MIAHKRLVRLSLFGILCVCFAMTGQARPSATQLRMPIAEHIGTHTVELRANDGRCRLRHNSTDIDLELPWPCDFHRTEHKDVQVYPEDVYPANKAPAKEYGDTKIVLVEASKRIAAKKCRTQQQAIKFEGGTVMLGKKTIIAACPPFRQQAPAFTAPFR